MAKAFVTTEALSTWQSTLLSLDYDDGSPIAMLITRIGQLIAENPERIDLHTYVELLEEIGQSSRPSSVAWTTGLAADLPFHGALADAVLGCPSLGTALSWLSQYFPLLQDASILRLDVEENRATLSYKILDPEIWPRHENAMFTLGIFAMLVKAAAPEAWGQVQITVEAAADQVRADLASIVKSGVIYGGSTNSIRMPTNILGAQLKVVEPCRPEVLKELAAALTRKRRSTPICERTRRMIYRQMNEGAVNQDLIARALGVSSRTLRRRLSADGQSFQKLLDECRMQFAALEFRTRSAMSLSEMALKLGYSEHSTFSRAFARWAGMPPQEYRRLVMTA